MLAYGDVYFTALVSRAEFALEFGVSPAPRMGPGDGSAISKSKKVSRTRSPSTSCSLFHGPWKLLALLCRPVRKWRRSVSFLKKLAIASGASSACVLSRPPCCFSHGRAPGP